MSAPVVFISSTFLEFPEERKRLHEIVTSFLPVACQRADQLTADSPDLDAALKAWIRRADVIILLLGIRYGSMCKPLKISWTEREIEHAQKLGKKILPYLKAQVETPVADRDRKHQVALEAFKATIRKKVTCNIPVFSDFPELVALAIRDLKDVVDRFQESARVDSYTD